jgi:hypothetical protein
MIGHSHSGLSCLFGLSGLFGQTNLIDPLDQTPR